MRSLVKAPLLSFLLLVAMIAGIAGAAEFLGNIRTSPVPTAFPVKGVTIGKHSCDYNGTDQTPFVLALAAGHKHLDVVDGDFVFTAAVTTTNLSGITIDARGGTSFTVNHSGAVGLFDFSGGTGIVVEGITATATAFVNSQVMVRATNVKGFRFVENRVNMDTQPLGTFGSPAALVGSTATPMVALDMVGCIQKDVSANVFIPSHAWTIIRSTDGSGARIHGNFFTANVDAGLGATDTLSLVPRLCWRVIQLDSDEWCQVSNNRIWGLGDWSGVLYGAPAIQELDEVIRIRNQAVVANFEQGHCIVDGNLIENTTARRSISLWGVPSCNVIGNIIGFNGSAPDTAGEAGIVITDGNGVDDTGSTLGGNNIPGAINIFSNDLHNLAKTDTEGSFIFVHKGDQVSINGNSISLVTSDYAIEVSSPNVGRFAAIGNEFWSTSGSPISPIRFSSGGTIANGAVVAANSFKGFTSTNCVTNNSTLSTKYFIHGLIDKTTGNPYVPASISAATIAAADANTITDSGNGLGIFAVGDVISLSGWTGAGATTNIGIGQVTVAAAGSIDVAGISLTADAAGETVTLKKLTPAVSTNIDMD